MTCSICKSPMHNKRRYPDKDKVPQVDPKATNITQNAPSLNTFGNGSRGIKGSRDGTDRRHGTICTSGRDFVVGNVGRVVEEAGVAWVEGKKIRSQKE